MSSQSFSQSSNVKAGVKESIFEKLWDAAGVSPHTDAHSKTLTANRATYALTIDDVKPQFMIEYLEETGSMHAKLHEDPEFPGELLGSWKTVYGDLDQAFNLWIYRDGYVGASKEMKYMQESKEMQEFYRHQGQYLRSRSNQLCQEFAFWGEPKPKKPSHIYELRSYTLKPGTLIEWGNNWSKAINIRRKDAVGGFFSQVGDLYQVHHLWAYNDLNHRKIERENMWQIPGWDDCVAQTVRLVRSMNARILVPTQNSQMQ